MIKKQLERLKALTSINQKCRQHKAKVILDFIESGGYLICGYDSFKSFFDACQDNLYYSKDYLNLREDPRCPVGQRWDESKVN